MKKTLNILKNSVYTYYTLIFLCIIFIIISLFTANGMYFAHTGDSIHQHFITLNYFREFLLDFINGKNVSTFTWNIGSGIDLFSNLSYYSFGDFISYFSVLFKREQMEVFYYVTIFIRLFSIGISFCYYSKCHKNSNVSTLVGALIYTFCGWSLIQIVHPYFLNALFIFPLLMISTEKFLLEGRKILFSLVIVLSLISNFYFSYFNFLIIAIYGSIIIFTNFKKKEILNKFISIILYSLLGILLSAFIIIPTFYQFSNSQRLNDFIINPYNLTYFRNFLKMFIATNGNQYGVNIGMSSIILITIPMLIINIKNSKYQKFVYLFLIMLLPLFSFKVGILFSAMSFAKHRWTYTLIFLLSYATVMMMNDDNSILKKHLKIYGLFMILFTILGIIISEQVINYQVFISIIIVPILLYFLYKKNHNAILLIVIINLISNVYYTYSNDGYYYMNGFVDGDGILSYYNRAEMKQLDNVTQYLNNKDDSYYNILRYRNHYKNLSLYHDYNSTSYYYSIIPKQLNNLSIDLANSEATFNKEIASLDYRTKINSLMSNKYLITYDDSFVPYGYNLINKNIYSSGNNIYQNKYYTNFVKYYDSYINYSDYQALSPLQKENILLKSVVLEDNLNYNLYYGGSDITEAKNEVANIDYQVIDNYGIYNKNLNSITVKSNNNNYIQLKIPKIENKELYLFIDGLNYEPFSKNELIDLELSKINNITKRKENEIRKSYKWYEKKYNFSLNVKYSRINKSIQIQDRNYSEYYYNHRNGLLINLGYYDSGNGYITILLNNLGSYKFNSISVLTNNFDNYEKDINSLNSVKLGNTIFNNNKISLDYNVEDDGILQFNTSYSKGWKILIDGEEVDSLEVNNYFLGAYSTKGLHHIELIYQTPFLKEGIIISVSSLIIYLGLFVVKRHKKRLS